MHCACARARARARARTSASAKTRASMGSGRGVDRRGRDPHHEHLRALLRQPQSIQRRQQGPLGG